ncbi:GntR family transcriptional regulator [uncultured Roseibium sp.]|uniref:GntR family transcriptional regulator n=1 Tax=uncultured Roseibium sp. TaxID=1936171 RepID=UPI003216B425
MTLADIAANPLFAGKNTSKSETVHQILKRRILLGYLTDDSPITEQALAQEFCCSQGTVREALLRLQECGLVDRRGYQGTFVTRTTQDEAVILTRMRVHLECTGVERAVAAADDAKIADLRELIDLYEESREKRDVFACSEIDRRLHCFIFDLADMPMLEPFLNRAHLQLHRYMVSGHQGNIVWNRNEGSRHIDILDAFERRDAASAKRRMKRHIAQSVHNLAPEIYAIVFEKDPEGEPQMTPKQLWNPALSVSNAL